MPLDFDDHGVAYQKSPSLFSFYEQGKDGDSGLNQPLPSSLPVYSSSPRAVQACLQQAI